MKKADLLNKSFRMSRSLQDNFDFWSYERGSPAFRGRGGETKKGQKRTKKGDDIWHPCYWPCHLMRLHGEKVFFLGHPYGVFFSEIRWVV